MGVSYLFAAGWLCKFSVHSKNVMIFWVKPNVGLGHFFLLLDNDLNVIEVSVGK